MKHKRSVSHTALFIGEGKTECAFLKYLKSLFIYRGCGVGVKIINAGGKGPEYIVDYALRQSRRRLSDRKIILLDSDIPIPSTTRKTASEHNFQLVQSEPCIEGLLLAILGKTVPSTTAQCKKQCANIFSEPLTEHESYKEHLILDILNQRRSSVPALDKLLKSFCFGD